MASEPGATWDAALVSLPHDGPAAGLWAADVDDAVHVALMGRMIEARGDHHVRLLGYDVVLAVQPIANQAGMTRALVGEATLIRVVARLGPSAPLPSRIDLVSQLGNPVPDFCFKSGALTMVMGPSGTGRKSAVACAALKNHAVPIWFTLEDAWLLNEETSDSRLFRAAKLAKALRGGCLVIDEMDVLFPCKAQVGHVPLLLEILSLSRDCTIIGIAQEPVHELLEARVDYTVRISPLGTVGIQKFWLLNAPTKFVEELVEASAGFSLRDCEAVLLAVPPTSIPCNSDGDDDENALGQCLVRAALAHRPQALSSDDGAAWTLMIPQANGVSFAQVAGQRNAKQALTELLVWPRTRKEEMKALGLRRPRGVLMHGPPGTGKTLLARAAAFEAKCNFISVSVADLIKGDVGATERLIHRLFATAKASAPCVVFFDEAQALFAGKGDVGGKLLAQFVVETDFLAENDDDVVLLGATNLVGQIDSALQRQGRFDRIVYVGPLDTVEDRLEMLRLMARRYVWDPLVKLEVIASQLSSQCTGAVLQALCERAAIEAEVRALEQGCEAVIISLEDWKKALKDEIY